MERIRTDRREFKRLTEYIVRKSKNRRCYSRDWWIKKDSYTARPAWETRRRKVIYVDIELKETIYFINVYAKNEKDDLTEEEKKAFKAVVKILKEE